MREMGKMLHNEARELLVESYEKTHNAEEIAKIFGVNKYTVYHMAERKRKTGSVALCGALKHPPNNSLKLGKKTNSKPSD